MDEFIYIFFNEKFQEDCSINECPRYDELQSKATDRNELFQQTQPSVLDPLQMLHRGVTYTEPLEMARTRLPKHRGCFSLSLTSGSQSSPMIMPRPDPCRNYRCGRRAVQLPGCLVAEAAKSQRGERGGSIAHPPT